MDNCRGLQISKNFYEQCCVPIFERLIPDVLPHMAVGLVGEGSDCFGFDDAISRDHDWGPALCLWLPQSMVEQREAAVEAALAALPASFMGFTTRMAPELRMGRTGLMSIEGFYSRFLRTPEAPKNWREWRQIPEHFLAVCTNGEVFRDDCGIFSSIRQELLRFYPEDIRLKKIAARCMGMAQAGQYNLPRSLRRGATVTAMLCAARFAEQALSMVYLLNKRYMPFYKWAYKGLDALPLLGPEAGKHLDALTAFDWRQGESIVEPVTMAVEDLCLAVAQVLRQTGLSTQQDNWLLEHGPQVQACIETPELRHMPVMLE